MFLRNGLKTIQTECVLDRATDREASFTLAVVGAQYEAGELRDH